MIGMIQRTKFAVANIVAMMTGALDRAGDQGFRDAVEELDELPDWIAETASLTDIKELVGFPRRSSGPRSSVARAYEAGFERGIEAWWTTARFAFHGDPIITDKGN